MPLLKIITISLITLILIFGCISPELRSARIALNEKDYQRALRQADLELQRLPGSSEAFYLKGYCYGKLGELARMSQFYDSSLVYASTFKGRIEDERRNLVARYYRRFTDYYDKQSLDSALAFIDTAIIVDPHNIMLYQQAAVTAYSADQNERALTYAQKAIALEPVGQKDLPTRQIVLEISFKNEEFDAAIYLAKEIMSLVADPLADTTGAYLRAFDVQLATYEKKQDYDAAEQAIADVIILFPGRNDILLNYALMKLRKNDFDGAAVVYKRILETAPDDFTANLNLGTILVNQGKWLDAIPYLKKAHELDASSRIAVQNLMAAYFNTDQEKLGLEMKAKLDALDAGK
ncbi:MAG: tetratricopeptide repeat protein [Calditrichaeota bacterium]|nr:tetratricopeptide repeat protein [Calditrichota bacterium]